MGYQAGWHDAKVAIDLGIPKNWVKQVREEMFGPEGASEELKQQLDEAKSCLDEIRRVGGSAETIVTTLRSLLVKADKIEKTMVDIHRAVS